MNRSDSIASLAAALVKAQSAISPAPKNATNPHYRSHYADLASVWDAARSALATNGLAVVQSPCDCGDGRVGLETVLIHSSGEWISSIVSAPLAKNDPQGVGSALTYLRRYALAATVGVTTTEDDDGEAASRPATAAPRVERIAPAPKAAPAPPIKSPPHVHAPAPVEAAADAVLYRVIDVASTEGTAKASGKPYTRYRVSFEEVGNGGGEPIKATTFSSTIGETCRDAMAANSFVTFSGRDGQYGIDLLGVEIVKAPAGGDSLADGLRSKLSPVGDEIPF